MCRASFKWNTVPRLLAKRNADLSVLKLTGCEQKQILWNYVPLAVFLGILGCSNHEFLWPNEVFQKIWWLVNVFCWKIMLKNRTFELYLIAPVSFSIFLSHILFLLMVWTIKIVVGYSRYDMWTANYCVPENNFFTKKALH